ncbi:hypothetical protein MKI84_08485 [Ancylobacter sp. A5.8]|uniref:hypothetical protein n=1 Tax=Ancylobacter gelatini TaxID=2919920 RepID=UPI001F4DD274|nr:hypothetical protein [Ancylobacter gelatini]MCJ8142952.1 hypothetical protein [Ancylobacter gelatini]
MSAELGRIGRQPSQLVVAHPARQTLAASTIIKASNFIVGFLTAAKIVKGGGVLFRPLLGAAGSEQAQGQRAESDSGATHPQDDLADACGGKQSDDVHAGTGAVAGQIAGMT